MKFLAARGASLFVILVAGAPLAAHADDPYAGIDDEPRPAEAVPRPPAPQPPPPPVAAPAPTTPAAAGQPATPPSTSAPTAAPAATPNGDAPRARVEVYEVSTPPRGTTSPETLALADEISRGHTIKLTGEVFITVGVIGLIAGGLFMMWSGIARTPGDPDPIHGMVAGPALAGVGVAGLAIGIPVYLHGRGIETRGIARLPRVAVIPTMSGAHLSGGAASMSFVF